MKILMTYDELMKEMSVRLDIFKVGAPDPVV